MTSPLPSLIERFKTDLCRLDIDGRIAVAVSGGPDSLALLLLAHAALGRAIIVATVDHGLRPEAADEAEFVAALCREIGVDHSILPVRVEQDGDGLQAAAREARYTALARWCEERGAATLLTAHHADDQAETVLMRLARGAGIGGLAGIRARRPLTPTVAIARPLLSWRKAELAEIVASAGIIARDDPSNRDSRYDRTAIRALLGQTELIDPQRVAASAGHLAEAEAALCWTTERAFAAAVTRSGDVALLDPADYPAEILRRMLVRLFAGFGKVPQGPALERLTESLIAGHAATLAGIKAIPGEKWRFEPAPPRRADR